MVSPVFLFFFFRFVGHVFRKFLYVLTHFSGKPVGKAKVLPVYAAVRRVRFVCKAKKVVNGYVEKFRKYFFISSGASLLFVSYDDIVPLSIFKSLPSWFCVNPASFLNSVSRSPIINITAFKLIIIEKKHNNEK